MLLRKEGFPDEGEIVLCTVTNIHFHSVFVSIDEYQKTGLVHISEISPGRIRNLRDFVVEGKKIVCKVLRIDMQKGHIDLSLRRVNDNQRRQKVSEIKQEQLAEKIVEFAAKKLDTSLTLLYKELKEKILKEYDGLYECFYEVSKGEKELGTFGIDKKTSEVLKEAIKQRIKEQKAVIAGTLELKTISPDGVEVVKKALASAQEAEEGVNVRYLSAGHYHISIETTDFKKGEKALENAAQSAIALIEKDGGEGSFARIGE